MGWDFDFFCCCCYSFLCEICFPELLEKRVIVQENFANVTELPLLLFCKIFKNTISSSLLHFYLDLFFVSVFPALVSFGSTSSNFPHCVALSWKAVFAGRLSLRISMTLTAPVFFRTFFFFF